MSRCFRTLNNQKEKMGSFRNFCISRGWAGNRRKYYYYKHLIISFLLLRVILLLPSSSTRQVSLFAPLAVFLFGPLIQERFNIGTAMPISGARFSGVPYILRLCREGSIGDYAEAGRGQSPEFPWEHGPEDPDRQSRIEDERHEAWIAGGRSRCSRRGSR